MHLRFLRSSSELQIFGWETDAAGEEYKQFLTQFIPELVKFIRLHSLEQSCYFHLSDEPTLHDLESYTNASTLVRSLFDGEFPIIDALSEYEFYEKGLLTHPVVSTEHIHAYIAGEADPLWAYYCCCGTSITNPIVSSTCLRPATGLSACSCISTIFKGSCIGATIIGTPSVRAESSIRLRSRMPTTPSLPEMRSWSIRQERSDHVHSFGSAARGFPRCSSTSIAGELYRQRSDGCTAGREYGGSPHV